MIGLVTQEARDAQNAAMKAAPVAAGAPPVHGVPSAAEGVAGHAGEGAGGEPGPLVPPGGAGMAHRGDVRAEDFRRPYIGEGHAEQSPGNPAGLASQSARVSELAVTAAGRRP